MTKRTVWRERLCWWPPRSWPTGRKCVAYGPGGELAWCILKGRRWFSVWVGLRRGRNGGMTTLIGRLRPRQQA